MNTNSKAANQEALKHAFCTQVRIGNARMASVRVLVVDVLAKASRWLSPFFWSHRGLNKAHWKLWRAAVAARGATVRRFDHLRCELECEGSEHSVKIARDIRKILESKY